MKLRLRSLLGQLVSDWGLGQTMGSQVLRQDQDSTSWRARLVNSKRPKGHRTRGRIGESLLGQSHKWADHQVRDLVHTDRVSTMNAGCSVTLCVCH